MSLDLTGVPADTHEHLRSLEKWFKGIHGSAVRFDVNQPIDPKVAWRPTLTVRVAERVLGIELTGQPKSSAAIIAAKDAAKASIPFEICIACPADTANREHAHTRDTVESGFGLLVFEADDSITERAPSIPLIAHIAPETVAQKARALPSRYKSAILDAYKTYRVDPIAGLQKLSQTIEAMISRAWAFLKKHALCSAYSSGKKLAEMIDDFDNIVNNHTKNAAKAAVGGVRYFVKKYRNTSSHPPKGAKERRKQMHLCALGFMSAIEVVADLRQALKNAGLPA